MQKFFEINSIKKIIKIFSVIFLSLVFIQNSNNALPFFYKDYPTYNVNGKQDFDSTSEALVLNRIDFSRLSMEYKYNFNLWSVAQEVRSFSVDRDAKMYDKEYKTTPNYLLDGQPYLSQIGAQSLFFAKIALLLNEDHGNYFFIKLLSVALLSIFFTIIIFWIYNNFGIIASGVSIIFLVLSTGVNIFSESLYWSIWLFVFPLSAVCLLDLCKVKNSLYIFILLMPVFLFKFLSGYEFITTIVFASMTPYAWDFFINKNTASLMRIFAVGISSIAAFLFSIFIYNNLFWGDFNLSGINHLFARSGHWSFGNLSELGISPWVQLKKILIMNFIDFNGYGIPLVAYLSLIFIAIFIIRRIIAISDLKFIIFLFAGSVSWLIIQPGHILFHPRYSTLIFFLPFGLFISGFITSLVMREFGLKKYYE